MAEDLYIKDPIALGTQIINEVSIRYAESHRHYHNLDHIIDIMQKAFDDDNLDDSLFLAILFHDIIYDPMKDDNEEESANLFKEIFKDHLPKKDLNTIYDAIVATKTHTDVNQLSAMLNIYDLMIIKDSTYEEFVEFEQKIFMEYQFVPYEVYKQARIAILAELGTSDSKINYVRSRELKIAVYPGSFNPFHKGHLDILLKAEKIFDKVIIARGQNPSKDSPSWDLPNVLTYRQTTSYKGMLTDYIDSLPYPVTVIRGLRNTTDLQSELTQYRFLQDMKPDIQMISIICDKEFDHISSSAIRMLKNFDKAEDYLP